MDDKLITPPEASSSAYTNPTGITNLLQVNHFSSKNFTVDDFEKIDKLSSEVKKICLDMLTKEQDANLLDRSLVIKTEAENHKSYNARITRAQWFALIVILASIGIVGLLLWRDHIYVGSTFMAAIVIIVGIMITGKVPQKIKANSKSSE